MLYDSRPSRDNDLLSFVWLYDFIISSIIIKLDLGTFKILSFESLLIKHNYLIRPYMLTLLHSESPKLYAILAFLSAIGLSQV